MRSLLFAVLVALIWGWATLRLWSRIAQEIPQLRAERRMELARRRVLLGSAIWALALILPTVLDIWLRAGKHAVGPELTALAMLPALVASGAIALPARRRALGETWGVAAYLGEQLGLLAAFGLGPLLLVLLPSLGGLPSPWCWIAPPIAAALSLLCGPWRQGALIGLTLRAGPLPEPTRSACSAVIEASGLELAGRKVQLASVGRHDGGVVNALAVPGLNDCRIFFSRRLLDLLDAREAAAVCAHEVAHLEYRNRRWVQRYRLAWLLLVLAGLGVALLLPQPPWWFAAGWVLILILALAWLQRRQRGEESACDARALALGADPDALASALAKLYRATLVPRRLPAAADSSMTHPSLARRLQALRELADKPLEPTPPAVWAASGRGWLRLDGDSLDYRPAQDAPPEWTKPLSGLIELCVLARRRGVQLALRGLEGGPLRLPLDLASAGTFQDQLDRVDHRLAPLPKRVLGVGSLVPWMALAVLVAIFADPHSLLTPAQKILILVPAIALLATRSPGALAVLAAVALGLALTLALAAGSGWATLAAAGVLAAAGIWGLRLVSASGERLNGRAAIAVGVAAVGIGIFAWLDAGLRPWDPEIATQLHAVSIERATLLLPLLALAAVMALRGRIARWLGISLGLAVVVALAATSARGYPRWAGAVGIDPLAAAAPAVPDGRQEASIESRQLPGRAWGLRLSPSGERFAAILGDADSPGPWTWVLGGMRGPLAQTRADALDFAGERWLFARREEAGMVLEQWDGTERTAPDWTLKLPAAPADAALWVDANGNDWSLSLWRSDEDEDPIGTYRGHLGSAHWHYLPTNADPLSPGTDAGTACPAPGGDSAPQGDRTLWSISAELRYKSIPSSARYWATHWLQPAATTTRVKLSGPDGARHSFATAGMVSCLKPGPERTLCLVRSGVYPQTEQRVWALERRTGRLVPAAEIDGDFLPLFLDDGGLLLHERNIRVGRLARIDPSGKVSAVRIPGEPLAEIQNRGEAVLGLRNSGESSDLVRLALPDGLSAR